MADSTDSKATDSKAAKAEHGSPRTAEQRPASQPREGNSGQKQDPGAGVADAVTAQHEARTTVPGYPEIDARLDNRSGADRPPLEQWPAKPQQIDGPDVAHQVEHTRATLRGLEDDVERKGQFSVGSHGLSRDESLREGRPVSGPDEG